MYCLTCDIEIRTAEGLVRLDHAESVKIAKQADSLCDTATLTLPRRIRWRNVAKNPIRRGDSIRISLGYDGRNHLAFVGLVRRVEPNTPMVIEAQDMMCQFQRREARKMAYTSVTLDRLLSDQGIDAEIRGSQSLGAYRVECNTVSELLDALKKQGIRSMMRIGAGSEPRMYAGLAMSPADARTFDFDDHTNIASRSQLQYQTADEVRFLVRVKNNSTAVEGRRTNKRIKPVEVGCQDGELRTFNVVGMTEAEMQDYARQQLSRLERGGLSGSLTVFGGQIVDKLDAVRLTLDGTAIGTYQVERNTIEWGTSGFRQKLTIGTQLSS